jgi:NAD(P)-dependent dehydrogenase (short-subunit alcohol dehydrogenase family)
MTPKPWTQADIPDQTGRTAIITGANTGLGFVTARALAGQGAHVVLACRNLDKGRGAQQAIQQELARAKAETAPGSTELMALDLADLDSVRAFARDYGVRHDRLDLLINNAGVMMLPRREETADGFERQIGINHLGHFALTGLLLPLLLDTPGPRVVVVSSLAYLIGRIQLDDLQSERSYSPAGAYGQSKLANLLFAYELQRRAGSAGADLVVAAAHPGWTATELQRHLPIAERMNPILAQTPEMGALPSLYAATAPGVEGGAFYGPNGALGLRGYPHRTRSIGPSRDAKLAAGLWTLSEKLTNTTYTWSDRPAIPQSGDNSV